MPRPYLSDKNSVGKLAKLLAVQEILCSGSGEGLTGWTASALKPAGQAAPLAEGVPSKVILSPDCLRWFALVMRIAAGDVWKPVFFLVLIMAFGGFAEAATQRVCTEAEVKEAQKEADQLRDWDSVYRSFKRFAHCDEGGIAEEYSDSVGRLLARDWKHLNAFVRLTADQDFEQFVIRHVDETMSEDEAGLVINNARLHCPSGAKRLCKSIADY